MRSAAGEPVLLTKPVSGVGGNTCYRWAAERGLWERVAAVDRIVAGVGEDEVACGDVDECAAQGVGGRCVEVELLVVLVDLAWPGGTDLAPRAESSSSLCPMDA